MRIRVPKWCVQALAGILFVSGLNAFLSGPRTTALRVSTPVQAAVSQDCPAGYQGPGAGQCTDINECAINHGGCDTRTTCTNAPGSYVCGACPSGYTGSGNTVNTNPAGVRGAI